jgi:anti-anti-sigma factor
MGTSFETILAPPRAELRIDGDLDLCAQEQLIRALLRIRASECARVSVDLSRVAFIDACTLGILDQERHRLEAVGGGLEVTGMSGRLMRVARLAGYDRLLAASSDRGPRDEPANQDN